METSDKSKVKSPENSANWLSKILLWWSIDLFRTAYKRELSDDDLFEPIESDVSTTLGDKLEGAWQEQVEISKKNGSKPSLNKAIVKVFWLRFALWGLFYGLNFIVLRVITPFALARFVAYFSGHERHGTPLVEAHIMNYVLVVVSLGGSILYQHVALGLRRVGMQLRIACCSLMYRKLLNLDVVALKKTAAGQVVNLMSNDVNRFDQAPVYLHAIWVTPPMVIVVAYLVWQHIGWATVAGLMVIVLQSVAVQGYLSKQITVYRSMVAKHTDHRLQLMSELVGGVQVIKMYAWEVPFQKIVASFRKLEIIFITKASMIRSFSDALSIFTKPLTLYASLVTFVLLGGVLRAEIAFSLVQYFNLIDLVCNLFLPLALTMFGEATISIKRIEEFLQLEDLDGPKQNSLNGSLKPVAKPTGVVLIKVSASWVPDTTMSTLQDISLDIRPGEFCAVVGPVGSGKSSLLQVLLGELPLTQGSLSLGDARVSFASQEPWLFLGTVRQNILFGEPYDRDRYKKVVAACALVRDFKLFPKNDSTVVGERGVSLSGGQRARIGLARAVYRKADVYLLDDPLSAVDTHVGKQLLTDCIDGFLKHKTRILVTHQLHHLKTATNIVILRNGQIESQGVFDEVSKNPLFSELLQEVEDEVHELGLSPKNPTLIRQRTFSEQSAISNAVSEAMSVQTEYEEEPETQELMGKGNISSSVFKDYFTAGNGWFILTLTALSLIIAQVITSMSKFWLKYWTNNVDAEIAISSNIKHASNNAISSPLQLNVSSTESSLIETTPVSIETQLPTIPSLLNDTRPLALLNNISMEHLPDIQGYFYIYIWTGLLAGCILFSTFKCLIFIWVCMKSSTKLHDSMFGSVLQATMHFFHTNPSGRILNRFSKDMGTVDEQLPRMMLDSLHVVFETLAILIVVAIVSPYTVLAASVCAVFMVLLTKVYVRTAQSAKRLEGVTKSPVYSHVSSSMAGLATVRAFDAQQMLTKQFDQHQNLHTSAWITVMMTNTAFSVWLSIISSVYIAAVSYSFLLLDDGTTKAGDVGLAINQSLLLTGKLQYGIKQLTDVVTQMTTVERIVQYTSLPLEHPLESPAGHRPPKDWPSHARVQFKNVYLRYAEGAEPVLRNLNITIESGWKVGVVGRTGAGKSSLISALFRLAVVDGEIIIDEIDTANIGLKDLRTKISIIPQEPVLFTASMRYNLDPFDKHTDADIWTALEDVELKDLVSDLSQSVSGSGSNLSAGQRQLVCLARAVLARNNLLVLDEATANVDAQTDSLIQKTIRSRFATCTVITVAHRLHTVADSDRVLVMDAGQVVQFDHPHLLLQDKQGTFAMMVEQMGPAAANALTEVSKQAYQQHIKFVDAE